MKNQLFQTICFGIATAMGVAVIVTNIVSPMPAAALSNLLGIGVLALGMGALKK